MEQGLDFWWAGIDEADPEAFESLVADLRERHELATDDTTIVTAEVAASVDGPDDEAVLVDAGPARQGTPRVDGPLAVQLEAGSQEPGSGAGVESFDRGSLGDNASEFAEGNEPLCQFEDHAVESALDDAASPEREDPCDDDLP